MTKEILSNFDDPVERLPRPYLLRYDQDNRSSVDAPEERVPLASLNTRSNQDVYGSLPSSMVSSSRDELQPLAGRESYILPPS